MLSLGGIINIIIAIGHIVGLLWAKQMFEATGAGPGMSKLARIHPAIPYLLTVFVSVIFFIFGLYGLSAAGKFRRLPFLTIGIFTIAAIYIFRGLGGLIFHTIQNTNSVSDSIYSGIALIIGLLFLFGGLKNRKERY